MGADVEENPRGTRVFKTRVSLLRLKFHHFNFFFLAFFKVTQCSIIQLELQCSSEFRFDPAFFFFFFLAPNRSSSVLPLFFVSSSDPSSVLCRQIVLPVSGLLFFKYQNWFLETRFFFLELDSTRLEIYLASYFPTHQVGIKSLILEF